MTSSYYASPWSHFADTTQSLTYGSGVYTGDFTSAKNLGLGLILARPTTGSTTDGIATVDVLCRVCDPGTPTEIVLTLTDVQVFLTMLRLFARSVRTLIGACMLYAKRDIHLGIAEHHLP